MGAKVALERTRQRTGWGWGREVFKGGWVWSAWEQRETAGRINIMGLPVTKLGAGTGTRLQERGFGKIWDA